MATANTAASRASSPGDRSAVEGGEGCVRRTGIGLSCADSTTVRWCSRSLPADGRTAAALDRAMDWLFTGQPHRGRQQRDDARVEDMPQVVRRADAIAVIAERFLGEPPSAEEGINTADRYQLVVHAPSGALIEYGDIDADDPPQIENGPVIATETVRGIACDSAMVRILESGDGEPLDVGRKTRVIPPAMHRALKRRDRGCRFPGCVNTGSSMAITSDTGPTLARRVRQPRAAVPAPSSAAARRWLLRGEGWGELHLLPRRRRIDPHRGLKRRWPRWSRVRRRTSASTVAAP